MYAVRNSFVHVLLHTFLIYFRF